MFNNSKKKKNKANKMTPWKPNKDVMTLKVVDYSIVQQLSDEGNIEDISSLSADERRALFRHYVEVSTIVTSLAIESMINSVKEK